MKLHARVDGVPYGMFARILWRRFLPQLIGVGVVVVAVLALFGRHGLRWQPLVLLAVFLGATAAVYRKQVRTAYRSGRLADTKVEYTFTSSGWEVRSGAEREEMSWQDTYRVRMQGGALLLYPKKKRVNIIPLACLGRSEAEQVLAWSRRDAETIQPAEKRKRDL